MKYELYIDKSPQFPGPWWLFLSCGIVAWATVFWGKYLPPTALHIGLVAAGSYVCVVGGVVVKRGFIWEMKCNDRCRRLAKVPLSKMQLARILYPDQWDDASIECEESHIPGDCPLCGAS